MSVGPAVVARDLDQLAPLRSEQSLGFADHLRADPLPPIFFVDDHHRDPADRRGAMKHVHDRRGQAPNHLALELGDEDGLAGIFD